MSRHTQEEPLSIRDILTNAVDQGHPQLAQEAPACFDRNCYKIGQHSKFAVPETTIIPSKGSYSGDLIARGTLHIAFALTPKTLSLPFEDHHDQLAAAVGAPPPFPQQPSRDLAAPLPVCGKGVLKI